MNDQPANDSAHNRVRTIVNRTTELTPLKSVAAKAIQMAEDERSAAIDLASVLSSDQALTAKLLRLSNSAYYGHSRRISNVREAVILLGMRTVRSVAIASGIMDSMRAPDMEDFDQELFWAHSVCVGLTAEAIARETRVARPEDAFTAGVLHDVGKLAMLIVEPEDFARTARLVKHEGMSYKAAEYEVFGVTHHQIGARLAQRWRFPEPLCGAIRDHHPAKRSSSITSLADITSVADLACNKRGLACGWDFQKEPERWPIEALPPKADQAIARLHGGMEAIEERARAFLLNVTAKPPRWYASQAVDEPMLAFGDDDEDAGAICAQQPDETSCAA